MSVASHINKTRTIKASTNLKYLKYSGFKLKSDYYNDKKNNLQNCE